jgi:hypothetical protein
MNSPSIFTALIANSLTVASSFGDHISSNESNFSRMLIFSSSVICRKSAPFLGNACAGEVTTTPVSQKAA